MVVVGNKCCCCWKKEECRGFETRGAYIAIHPSLADSSGGDDFGSNKQEEVSMNV